MPFGLFSRCRASSSSPLRHLGARWNSTLPNESGRVAAAAPKKSSKKSGGETTHYRITLRRSAIGLPAKTRRIVDALGLTKRLQSVYRPQRPEIAGMVLAIKELVHVENVRRVDGGIENAARAMADALRQSDEGLDTINEQEVMPFVVADEEAVWVNQNDELVDWGGKEARKAPRGYTVIGNLASEERHRQIITAKLASSSHAAKSK